MGPTSQCAEFRVWCVAAGGAVAAAAVLAFATKYQDAREPVRPVHLGCYRVGGMEQVWRAEVNRRVTVQLFDRGV